MPADISIQPPGRGHRLAVGLAPPHVVRQAFQTAPRPAADVGRKAARPRSPGTVRMRPLVLLSLALVAGCTTASESAGNAIPFQGQVTLAGQPADTRGIVYVRAFGPGGAQLTSTASGA